MAVGPHQAPPTRHVSPETLLPLVKSSQTPGIGQELVSDSGCSGGVTLVASEQAPGGGPIVSSFEDIIPLGSGTPSTFKAPLSQPPPPSLHQHAGSGCPNTRGLFSLHAQGGGLGAGGPHTLPGPGCREAGLPHPMAPDRLCPPSYSHPCSPLASITVT